ncbi:MAG: hypothetical protein ACK5LS_07260 [Propioniciclava sp.]
MVTPTTVMEPPWWAMWTGVMVMIATITIWAVRMAGDSLFGR